MKRVIVVAAAMWIAAYGTVNEPRVVWNKGTTTVDDRDAVTIPRMLSYQGRLTDTLGVPVADTLYSVRFRLYTQPTGGTHFWEENQQLSTKAGLFSVLLGSVTPIASVPDAGALYLGLAVAGGSEMLPRLQLVSAAYAYKADTANYALASAGGVPDSVPGSFAVSTDLRVYGKGRIGASNSNPGAWAFVAGVTNSALGDYSAVTGGADNTASQSYAVVGGGSENSAEGVHSTIAGGTNNEIAAGANATTISGGEENRASANHAVVGGGLQNTASGPYAVVAGGYADSATGHYSTISGGGDNVARGWQSTVGGGWGNLATGDNSVVAGGVYNFAGEQSAAVGGGKYNIAAAPYSFAANSYSTVPASWSNAAAFNGQTATTPDQTRVAILSKTAGTFTIDHPLDPTGKILNHYFIEGPEMRNIYDGEAILDASGRAVVMLPDYFDALNRNPRVQLTGVGGPDAVYVAEDVSGNRFAIGGNPGTKVYWQVTGEREDVSAEITRRMMPVEQPKTGALTGCMLDDDFLVGCMDHLVREGKAAGIDFRTVAGRQRYEQMKQMTGKR